MFSCMTVGTRRNVEDQSGKVLDDFAKLVARESRVAQRALEKLLGKGACKSLFQLSGHLVTSALAGMADDEVLVPVPADIASRIPALAHSLHCHQKDVTTIGHGVHYASHACHIARRSKSLQQVVEEKSIHRKAAAAKHEFNPRATTIFLETLIHPPDPWAGKSLPKNSITSPAADAWLASACAGGPA